MCKLSLGEAQQFYAVHQGKPFYDTLTHFMSSGRVVAMELVRPGAPPLPHLFQGMRCPCLCDLHTLSANLFNRRFHIHHDATVLAVAASELSSG